MSKEYGIDPEEINTFDSFFRIVPHFGPNHFRFIRRYPKKWVSLVKRAIDDVAPKAKAKIIEKLIQIDKELISCLLNHNGSPTFDGNQSWYENALNYHSIQPFDGIISNCASADPIVCNKSAFDVDTNPIFNVTTSFKVRRSADDMAYAVRQLLQHAREIHFVDPLFENLNRRHTMPLIKFITTICDRISTVSIAKVEYHIGNNISDEAGIKSSIDKYILPRLPQAFTINFIRWQSDLMHNRFILTDIGGVSFGIGLDDDDFNPNQKQYDDLAPLSYEVCLEKDCGGIKFMNHRQPIFYSITGT